MATYRRFRAYVFGGRDSTLPLRILKFLLLLTLVRRGTESFSMPKNPSVQTDRSRCYQSFKSVDNYQPASLYNQSLPPERPPIPIMPSDLFQRMAHSQVELLANSLTHPGQPSESKVDSMALYLPQENVNSGQLEFTPVVLYPDPNTERVFIASDAGSGQAPTLPKTLTILPGFAHATTLLPGYPMMSSDEVNPGVGFVEEVVCDPRFKNKPAALSVPLLSGSQTVGVLLVTPSMRTADKEHGWTEMDRQQVSRAAQSLSVALSMDNERNSLKEQNEAFREGLSDSLHQLKNPLQALRTYGKILQRQIADTKDLGGTVQILELAQRLMVQSDRVVDLMVPMDTLVDNLEHSVLRALQPAKNDLEAQSLVVWEKLPQILPWENDALEFARENGTVFEFSSQPSGSLDATRKRRKNDPPQLAFPKSEAPMSSSPPSSPPPSTVVGDLETEMTFVTDVLEPILSAYEAIATERGIYFEVLEETSELPGVMAAPRSFQEAVSNVLDNAFKYVMLPKPGSPFSKNTAPRVRVRMFANEDPSGVTLVVEDNGPGIQDGDRKNIFKRGFRSEETNSVDGTGIGLDICLALLQRMGGVLAVAEPGDFSDSLNGAVMKFTLFRQPRL
jgi:signal transduction histidine kinase